MKRMLLVCIFVLSIGMARSQYVLIPDSNFRHALINQGFASCFDVTMTMLDTTCSGVLDSTVLNVSHDSIRSIEGIQYFKSLNSLNCSYNPLGILALLPDTLSYLLCQYDSLTSLPPFPSRLYYLACTNNQLASIPTLPNTVRWLDMSYNYVAALPPLPTALYGFECAYNLIDSFPSLPIGLGNFECGYNPITQFPTLPSGLKLLVCDSTGRDTLPSLPTTLQTLSCAFNNLLVLPMLPPKLKMLNCRNNQLSVLPTFPDSVVSINCSSNILTALPSLPDSLALLDCSLNPNLSCLPNLNIVVVLNCSNTAITCLPDTPKRNTNITPQGLPICNEPCAYVNGVANVSPTSLNVYPNPVSDILYVDYPTQNSTFTICDLTGRVLTMPITDNGINVLSLPSGVYFIHIQNDMNSMTGKFVKE